MRKGDAGGKRVRSGEEPVDAVEKRGTNGGTLSHNPLLARPFFNCLKTLTVDGQYWCGRCVRHAGDAGNVWYKWSTVSNMIFGPHYRMTFNIKLNK